jgi:signal transduction histidine kinase
MRLKLPFKERVSSAAIVVALAAVLLVLAVVQYRWSSQVSEVARMRMKANLQASLMGFRQDLYHELSGVCLALRAGPLSAPEERWPEYAQHFQQWSRSAAHPGLVANLYIWKDGDTPHAEFLRLDRETGEFKIAQWPPGFESLRNKLRPFTAVSVHAAIRAQGLDGTDSVRSNRPFLVTRTRGPELVPWGIEQDIPALVSPLLEPQGKGGKAGMGISIVIVELNRKVLHDEIFPELAERYFGGADGYRLAVVGGEHRQTIYSSDASFDSTLVAKADATMNLFGPPLSAGGPGPELSATMNPPGSPFRGPGPGEEVFATMNPGPPMRAPGPGTVVHIGPEPPDTVESGGREFHMAIGPVRFGALDLGGDSSDWTLVVQHRNGSLENSVAAIRRRNLAMSFGVLLVLAATMGIIVITSQRARRLATLQMDFVAAVSHELRTPLTVISSAAENIEDGVVNSNQQMRRYGSVIKGQARQLIQLVEQVLQFAATRQHRHQYHLQRLEVAQVVGSALEGTAGLIQAAAFTVDKEIQPHLPSIEGDAVALAQCLQNLIANAVKYGGQAQWLAVRAFLAPVGDGAEIQISVEDKGVGIAGDEMDRIFEPFYRSPSVAAAQVHGTGLGLPLAKSIAEAMNGRLTVSSQPGNGSVFVLHLPVAPRVEADAAHEATAHAKTE